MAVSVAVRAQNVSRVWRDRREGRLAGTGSGQLVVQGGPEAGLGSLRCSVK
jgi:hypothetical protein